jgi:hypothetical protein
MVDGHAAGLDTLTRRALGLAGQRIGELYAKYLRHHSAGGGQSHFFGLQQVHRGER